MIASNRQRAALWRTLFQPVMLGPVPSIPVGQTQGHADIPREAMNRDSRDKPENDPVILTARAILQNWKRAPWHAFPAQAGIQPARKARFPHTQ